MGYGHLCENCRQLSQATFIRNERPPGFGYRLLPVDTGTSQYRPHLRASFRASWPASKLSQVVCPDQPLSDEVHLQVHSTIGDLRYMEKRKECHLCHLIYDRFKGGLAPLPSAAFVFAFIDFTGSNNGYLQARVFQPVPLVEGTYKASESARLYLIPIEARHHEALENLSGKSINPITLGKLQHWLHTCKGSHSKCSIASPQPPKTLPTRLVKLFEINGRLKINLVETRELDLTQDPVVYATLSHCWGPKGLPVKLTKANYFVWRAEIPLHTLSKTFRDTIETVHTLQIKYVWIDALCIRQDPEDWQQEAPLMGTVYSGSLVTLAATASEDGHGGLFAQDRISGPVSVSFKEGPQGPTLIGDMADHYSLYVQGGPLNKRAWVFQEKLLSTRVIHFTQCQLIWECSEHMDIEGNKEQELNDIYKLQYVNSFVKSGNWEGLVSAYSKLHLSFFRDRLVAISGVADAFGLQNGLSADEYLAGLWKPGLPTQLLWRTEIPNEDLILNRHDSSVGPSWSWVSHQGRAVFPGKSSRLGLWMHDNFEVMHVAGPSDGRSAFSSPCGGKLLLKTLILRVKKYDGLVATIKDRFGKLHRINCSSDWGNRKRLLGNVGSRPGSRSSKMYVLPIAYAPGPRLYLMVVRPVEKEKGKFVRLDLWNPFSDGNTPPPWWYEGSEIDEALCLKRHRERVYEIEMI